MPTAIDKIRILYSQHRTNFSSQANSLEQALDEAEHVSQESTGLKQFDSYPVSTQNSLSLLLARLPHELVISDLGREALIWAWVKYPYEDATKENLEANIKNCDVDFKLLERAKLTAKKLHNSSDGSTIIKTYELLHGLNDVCLQNIDLPMLLRLCTKQNINPSEKRIKDYGLTTIPSEGTTGYIEEPRLKKSPDGKKKFSIYLDAPIAVGLMYKGEPNAVVAFSPKDAITFFISQLQGVIGRKKESEKRAHSRGLITLEWEKLLVHISENIGKMFNFEQIAIQGSRNNKWLDCFSRARTRYDKTAIGLSYRKKRDGNWYKSLLGKPDEVSTVANKESFWSRIWPLRYFRIS